MEKKKSSPFIIPASFFKNITKEVLDTSSTKIISKEIKKTITAKRKIEAPKIEVKNKRKPSALSLKSIERKKELQNIEVNAEEVDGLPSDSFSNTTFTKHWESYIKQLLKKGKKSVAAIMQATTPKINNFNIEIELPNQVMKAQLERFKPAFLRYIRENLNNYKVDLVIYVNETITNKYAYTPQEKYNKLKEKNPTIATLKKTFNLDL